MMYCFRNITDLDYLDWFSSYECFCEHEFKFTCPGFCRFTLRALVGVETLPLLSVLSALFSAATLQILYSYLVGCCQISDLFGKGEPILGEA